MKSAFPDTAWLTCEGLRSGEIARKDDVVRQVDRHAGRVTRWFIVLTEDDIVFAWEPVVQVGLDELPPGSLVLNPSN